MHGQNIDYADYGTVLTFSGVDLRGEGGVGVFVAVVRAEFVMQPLRPHGKSIVPRIISMHGLLTVGARHAVLATLQTVPTNIYCQQHKAPTHRTDMRAILTAPQVRALDAARDQDGGFDLHADITFEITGHTILGTSQPVVRATTRITASDWSRIMREMEFEDRATFDIPIEGGRVKGPLEVPAKHMRTAIDQLHKHDWPDALKWCREVLDELDKHLRVPTPAWAEWETNKGNWGIPERVSAMQAAVRHMTHAGAHAKIGNAEEHEVRLAVAMTGAVLRYYASR